MKETNAKTVTRVKTEYCNIESTVLNSCPEKNTNLPIDELYIIYIEKHANRICMNYVFNSMFTFVVKKIYIEK